MHALFKTLLPVALLIGGATQAADASISIAHQETQGLSLWTSSTGSYQTGGMQYLSQGGGSFEAFCIEIAQDHYTTGQYASYTVGDFSATPLLQRQGQLLQGLFSSSYAGVDTALERAAFQVAVWEITHETGGQLDASYQSGSFYFSDFDQPATLTELLDFEQLANGYLQAASGYKGLAQYQLSRLVNADAQDLVTAAPVPEPESYALMLGGLALIGWSRRRRT